MRSQLSNPTIAGEKRHTATNLRTQRLAVKDNTAPATPSKEKNVTVASNVAPAKTERVTLTTLIAVAGPPCGRSQQSIQRPYAYFYSRSACRTPLLLIRRIPALRGLFFSPSGGGCRHQPAGTLFFSPTCSGCRHYPVGVRVPTL